MNARRSPFRWVGFVDPITRDRLFAILVDWHIEDDTPEIRTRVHLTGETFEGETIEALYWVEAQARAAYLDRFDEEPPEGGRFFSHAYKDEGGPTWPAPLVDEFGLEIN